MTGLLRAIAAAGIVAGVVACSSSTPSTEKTGSSGVADPATGCVLAGDASTSGYPTLADLPSGACDDSAKTCDSLVAITCTNACASTYLALYDCTCTGGSWLCGYGGSSDICPPCPTDAGDDDAGD